MAHSGLFWLLSVLLVSIVLGGEPCQTLFFLPMPQSIKCNLTNGDLQAATKTPLPQPCKTVFIIHNQKHVPHVQELIKHQQKKTFSCALSHIFFAKDADINTIKFEGFNYRVQIKIEDIELKSAFKVEEEAYTATIQDKKTLITTKTYVGFVRALQTFYQSIQCPKLKYKNCHMIALPLIIQDKPSFSYRGLMVDTSRHFLPIHLLYETIDALMYNKMNVLHWHITDQDAFPLILQSHPEIAKHGAFSDEQTYTAQEARDLVRYAMVRGVRVIPQLDTPGHAASWGKAEENKGTACTFGSGYMGPLDVTLDKTYKLVKEVFAEIIDIFPDPIIHCGGDEVVLTCLQNKTEFMNKEGIKENEIERHYRRKQHKIIKELSPNKIPMYWMNSRIDIEDGDIVHWWGGGQPQTTNPVVISNYGPYYLDMGVGNYFAMNYGNYITWLDLYNQNVGRAIQNYNNKDNVLGAEICLWSEISNRYTHHMKIWIRGSALAERTWTTKQFNPKPDFFRRITAHERLMNRRGIPTAPATCEQCETHPQFC